MIVVVGSGPAGIAAAAAALDRGREVLVLDGGGALEPERVALRARLAATPPADWDPADVAALKGGMRAGPSGVPVKLAWGSDFAYRDAGPRPLLELRGVDVHPSYARGGHSQVWGAALLPYRARELEGWPLGADDLAPHYAAVLGLLDHRAPRDDLSEMFAALPPSTTPPLEVGAQARGLLADLAAHREALAASGIRAGGARLAVRDPGALPCVYCGMCLYGCPRDLIWNGDHGLARLAARPGLRHRSGVVVERVVEAGGAARLHLRRRADGGEEVLEAERVLLAAGVLSSTRLALEALGRRGTTVTVRCSEYFVAPFLRTARARGAAAEARHTLAQAFVELEDAGVDEHLVHLQLYGHNDLLETAVEELLGPARRAARLARPLLEQVMVSQGYLHQDVSSRIHATLHRDGVLEARGVRDRTGHAVAARALRALARHARALRGAPLLPLLRMGEPGAGNHFGASFPMRAAPGPLESDLLGRPGGLGRVHLVDAACFSAIAAPTITLTVMANAHRIAAAAAGLPA